MHLEGFGQGIGFHKINNLIFKSPGWGVGNRRGFEITEMHCVAKGDEYCRFEVGGEKE